MSKTQAVPLPETGYLRLPQIIGNPKADPPIPAIIPVSKSSWWQGIKDGRFPQSVKLGPRTTVWRVEDIRRLIRSAEYRQVGGHETIRLRPDDDIKLGKIIKLAGFRQDAAYAPEFLSVEWYSSVGDVIRGLEKNAFSGADYNIPLVLAGVLFHILCSVWPFVAIFILSGWAQLIYLATALLILLTVADSARFHHSRPWYAIGYPLTAALFVYIMVRTMLLNLYQGGIRWRGTFYPLKELKGNRI